MGTSSVITLEVLQDLIQDTEPGVVLEAFEMEAGCGRGDNYTAMLYRVGLRGKDRRGQSWRRQLICKVLPSSARRREAYKSDALFRNEVAFYLRALPALLHFEARRSAAHGAPTPLPFSPRCYRAQDNLVVLEDLRPRGFTMVDRRQGLDERQLRAILSRIAHFHALSLAMKALEPETFASVVSGAIRETQFVAGNEDWYHEYYRTANDRACAMVRDGLPGGPERERCLAAASAFLLDEDDGESFFKRMVALVEPIEPLAVLCHGDCWTNNFLFRYDDSGDVQEVLIVDYQMSRYGSPCLDLVLLLYCCTERRLRETALESLLRHYHAAVFATLRRLGCTDPPLAPYAQPDRLWDMLTSEMHRLGRFGLGQAVDYVPCLCCDSEEAPNVYEGVQGAQGPSQHDTSQTPQESPSGPAPVIAASERCVRRIAELVQELVAKGDL